MNRCPRCGWEEGLTPRKAAQMITKARAGTGPGGSCSAQTIRNMCRDGRIAGAVIETENTGADRYWVPRAEIEAMIRGERETAA